MRFFFILIAVFVLHLAASSFATESVHYLNSSRPILLAHRGSRFISPENTLLAYDIALEFGADVLELDVTSFFFAVRSDCVASVGISDTRQCADCVSRSCCEPHDELRRRRDIVHIRSAAGDGCGVSAEPRWRQDLSVPRTRRSYPNLRGGALCFLSVFGSCPDSHFVALHCVVVVNFLITSLRSVSHDELSHIRCSQPSRTQTSMSS